MAVSVNYEIGESIEYANTPLVYRVVVVDGIEVSKEYATFEEIAANEALEDEYLTLLREHFVARAEELFTVESLSELDTTKLVGLNNCTTYLLQKLTSISRANSPIEE
jgi:hypothetical protein